MFRAGFLVPALALASHAAAQCSSTATFTIQNQGDAGTLSGCSTYTGDIAIATTVASAISLDGVQRISGNLAADNAVMLPQLSAGSLQQIDKTFSLTNMTLLTGLSFPVLSTVGTIQWTTLPRLSSLSFTNGVTKASVVNIYDTQLGSLSGINLQTVDQITVSNNGQLSDITMQLEEVTGAFNIEFNGRNTQVSLPKLQTAYNMTFRSISAVSIPALSTVNSSMGFYEGSMTSISAPNITSITGDLSFVNNNKLTNISFPLLTAVAGAVQVANNSALDDISGFPQLSKVGGAIDFYGNFSSAELPDLTDVEGAFNLQSSKNIDSSCSKFSGETGKDSVIKGSYVCEGSQTNPGGVGSSTSTSTSTSTQKGAAGRDMFARSSAVTGVLGVFAAMFGML